MVAAQATLALLTAALVFTNNPASALPAGATTIDQRQYGDYNVNLDVRNVEVVAILGDYGSYEYEDYEDPEDTDSDWLGSSGSSTTTASPVSVSLEGWSDHSTSASPPSRGSTPAATDGKPTAASLADDTEQPDSNDAANASSTAAPEASSSAATEASTPARRKCNVGYFRDRLGRCRRVQPTTLDFPFGFRVAPKFRREKLKEASNRNPH